MPFREPALTLRDIIEAIGAIEEFTRGMDFEAFRSDPKTVAAVERKLQTISEAGIRLSDEAEVLCPGQPWRNIRGIGNWLRHQYDRIDLQTIWETLPELQPLKQSVHAALVRLQPAPQAPKLPLLG